MNGPLTGEDFDVDQSKFTSSGEFVQSAGMIIDITALFSKHLAIPLPKRR